MTERGQVHVVSVGLDELRGIVRDELTALLDEREPERTVDGLLAVDETCAALRISRTTLTRLRAEGLPVVWILESPRFRLAAVIAWLEARPRAEP